MRGAPSRQGRPRRGDKGPAVVVPVYRGMETTLRCLARVLDTVPARTPVIVIDDAGPEPALSAALDALARSRRIRLVRNPRNLGFPASANIGLAAAGGRDVVLLNSDTIVPPGWLERLRDAAWSAPDIGTVAPLSNDATILSYPRVDRAQPPPPAKMLDRIDRMAAKANGASVVDIPTSVGFCMYVRHDCLEETGFFREDVFAQGYGEENDFCLRAPPSRLAPCRGDRGLRRPCRRAILPRGAPSICSAATSPLSSGCIRATTTSSRSMWRRTLWRSPAGGSTSPAGTGGVRRARTAAPSS